MKRYFYLIAAIAGLFMAASCQKENFEVAEGDYADVSFTTELPSGVATKAIADGQTVNKLYYEVYAAEDAEGTVAPVTKGDVTVTAGTASVNVRLVKNKSYTVFFWAQYEGENYTSPYTWTDLRNISVSYTNAVANDERRDAFYFVAKGVKYSGATTTPVTLTRPFAQVNVGTADLTTLTERGITLGNTSISVSDVATSFAPFTGVASGPTNAEFTAAAIADEDLTTNGKTYDYLAMAYVLVPGSADDTSVSTISSTVSFTGLTPITVSYEGATLKQNHRTNIVGNLLTSSVDFDVTVDSDFDGADSNLPMGPNDLAAKLNAYTSTEAVVYNIVSPSTAGIDIEIPSTFAAETVTFNFIEIKTGATLTIKDATGAAFGGEVVINLPENVSMSNLTVNLPNAHVTLKQGNVTTVISSTSSNTFVVADGVKVENITVNAGNVTIEEGGEVKVIEVGENNSDEETTVTVNEGATVPVVRGKEGSSIVVQNVSDNGDVVESAPINIGKFTYSKNGVWNASETLKDAIANADANTTVTMGADFTSSEKIVIDKSLTLNGNGYTLTYTSTDRAITVENTANGANLAITNLTVNCNNASSCERGINYNTTGSLTLDKVTVKGTNITYAVNLPSSSDNATVTITNCDLTGKNTLNIWGENMTINVTDSKLTSVDDSPGEDYACVMLNNDGTNAATNTTVNISGGSITAYNHDSDLSFAVLNYVIGNVNISDATEVTGKIQNSVAIILFDNPNNYYAGLTLGSAIKTALEKNAVCVKLVADVELTETCEITDDITIDLNGHTLTYNVKSGRAFDIIGDNVTFTVDAEGSNVEFGNETYGFIQLKGDASNAKVTVNGGTFTGTSYTGSLIRFRNGGNNLVTLKNVNYTDNDESHGNDNAWVVYSEKENVAAGNKLIVNGGEFLSVGGFNMSFDSEFYGATISTKAVAFELKSVVETDGIASTDDSKNYTIIEKGTYKIKDCTVTVSEGITIGKAFPCCVAASYGGEVSVEGGSLNSDSTEEVYALGTYASGGKITAQDVQINFDDNHIMSNKGSLYHQDSSIEVQCSSIEVQ